MRLAVYTDYSYRRRGSAVFGERAFVLFIDRLAEHVDRLVLLGRLDERPGKARYEVSAKVDYVPLPYYESAARPLEAGGAWLRSLGRFWRTLPEVDAVWLLGPHPLCLAFAALALLRGRTVVLGVRQNLPVYVRARHPGGRAIRLAADVLDGAYRLLARRLPAVVVGPELGRRYRRAGRLLEISVTLVDEADLVDPEAARGRDYGGRLQALSVGRIDTEKNPLLLADALAELRADDDRWELVVCGEGPLEERLEQRLRELDLQSRSRMIGYVALHDGLLELYRESHALLHVSWTEGVPQVLYEAFAAGLPVVATAVGGVEEAAGGAALLIPPDDARAASEALERIAAEPQLRDDLIRAGLERVRSRTLSSECARVAAFIAGASRPRPR